MPLYTFLSTYDTTGYPSNINVDDKSQNIHKSIGQTLIDDIHITFPENRTLVDTHPNWIKKSDIRTIDTCEITLTFIHEGAGYKNGLSYYIYDLESPPTRFPDVGHIYVVFPNASMNGSGGSMNTGDTMKIPYSVTSLTVQNGIRFGQTFDYVFPKNKGIAFVLHANRWRSGELNVGHSMYSSDPVLNPESSETLKHHFINYISPVDPTMIIYGVEDIKRTRTSDHDFNDLVFSVNPSPMSAIDTSSYNSRTDVIFEGTTLAEDLLALQETDLSLQSQLVDAVSNVDAFGNRILDLETLTDIVRISGPGEGGFLNTMIGVSAEAGDPAAENRIVLGYLAEGITNNTVMLGNQNITAVMPHALGSCSLGTADNPFTEVHCSDMYSSGDLNINNIAVTGNIATAGLTSTGIVSTTISSEFVTASDSLSTPLLKSTTTGADNTSIALRSSEIDITGELRVNGVSITDQLQNITASPGVTDFVGNIIVGGNMSVDNNLQTDIITNLFNTLVVGDISVFADSFLNPTLANGGTFLTQTSLPTPGIPAIDTVNGWVQFTSETVPSQFAHIIYSDIGKIAQIRSAREMYFNHTLRIRDTSGRNGQGFIVYFSETAPTGTSSVLTNLHKAYAINIRTGIGRLDLNYNGANQIFENVFPIFDNDQDYEIGIRVVKNGMRNITFHFLVDGTEVFRTTQPYQATVDYFNHCGFAAYTTSLGNNTTDYLIRSMDFGYVAGPGTSIALGGSEIAMTGDVNVTGDLRVNTVLQDTGPDCYGQISSGNGEFTIALPEGIKRTLNTQDVPGLVLNTHFQGINQTNGVTFGYSIITPGTYRVSANVSTKLGDNSTEVHFGLYYLNILTGLTTPAEHQSVIGGITPIMPEPQNNKFVSQSINCILPGLAVHDWLFLGMKSMGGAQTATIQYLSMNIERLRTST